MKGDRVLVTGNRTAKIQLVLTPGSELAHKILHPEGGFFIEFDDGDYQLWHEADEDIVLLNRK